MNRPTSTRARPQASTVCPDLAELADLLDRAGRILARLTSGNGAAPSIASAGAVTAAVTINQAMKIVPVGRTKLNDLIRDGVIVRMKIGRRTLLSRASIEKLLNESVVPS